MHRALSFLKAPRDLFGVAILFGLLSGLIVIWFCGFKPHHLLADERSDIGVVLWEVDWVARSIAQGDFSGQNTQINYPQGGSLFPARPYFSLAICFLQLFFNPALALNLGVAFLLFIGAGGMFLFARKMTNSSIGGFIAGLAYSFSPFMLLYTCRSAAFEMAGLWLLPLGLTLLIRAQEKKSWVVTIAGGIVLGLVYGSNPQTGLMAIFLTIALGVPALFQLSAAVDEQEKSTRKLRQPLIALILALLIAAAPLYGLHQSLKDNSIVDAKRFIEAQPKPPFIDFAPGAPSYYVAGLADYVLPRTFIIPETSLFIKTVFLSWSLIVSALLGLLLWRSRWKWYFLFCGFFFAILSSGPYLLANNSTGLAGPWNLVYWLAYWLVPFFNQFLEPFRFGQLAIGPIALLASFGLSELQQRYHRRGFIIAMVLCFFMGLEIFLLLFPTIKSNSGFQFPKSSDPAVLAAAATDVAIVELPFHQTGQNALLRRDRFANQILHHKPIPDTLTGFLPDFIIQNGFLGRLLHLERPNDFAEPVESINDGLDTMRRTHFKRLVIAPCLYHAEGEASAVQFFTEAGLPISEVDKCLWVIDL